VKRVEKCSERSVRIGHYVGRNELIDIKSRDINTDATVLPNRHTFDAN
jgi:hypothetical protein